MKEQVIEHILQHKIVVIVRGVYGEDCLNLVRALYAGGIWLLAILLFVAVGALYQREKVSPRLTLVVGLLAVFTVIVCICLFLTPYDANYANHRNYDLKWVNGLLKWK